LVEVRDVRVEGHTGKAEVTAAVHVLDRKELERKAKAECDELVDQARARAEAQAAKARPGEMRTFLIDRRGTAPDDAKEMKKLFVRFKIEEETLAQFGEKFQAFAQRRPNWYTDEIEKRTTDADLEAVRLLYQDLLFPRLAEEYLKELNFKPITQADDFDDYVARVRRRLEGVHLVLSGQVQDAKSKRKAEELLGGDLQRLGKAYLADVQCRFFPQTDADDPNAQWFNGQRISCRADGVATIQVQGHLDPKHHDRVDWWIVDRYDPALVHFEWPHDAGFRIDPPYPSEHGARLRVVSTGAGPVDYRFEFRPAEKRGGTTVSIHESPEKAGAKFPF
jgi:hypothetical protein